MDNKKEDVLIVSAREYFKIAEFSLKEKGYNSAVVLYFKSLVALCDLYILRKTGEAPSSHVSRFRIAESSFPEIYGLLDKDFPFYQNSYNQKMSNELAEVIKNDAKFMAEKTETDLS